MPWLSDRQSALSSTSRFSRLTHILEFLGAVIWQWYVSEWWIRVNSLSICDQWGSPRWVAHKNGTTPKRLRRRTSAWYVQWVKKSLGKALLAVFRLIHRIHWRKNRLSKTAYARKPPTKVTTPDCRQTVQKLCNFELPTQKTSDWKRCDYGCC